MLTARPTRPDQELVKENRSSQLVHDELLCELIEYLKRVIGG